jgi:hypothetical protein
MYTKTNNNNNKNNVQYVQWQFSRHMTVKWHKLSSDPIMGAL